MEYNITQIMVTDTVLIATKYKSAIVSYYTGYLWFNREPEKVYLIR